MCETFLNLIALSETLHRTIKMCETLMRRSRIIFYLYKMIDQVVVNVNNCDTVPEKIYKLNNP